MKRRPWLTYELEYLCNRYSKTETAIVARVLDRSEKSVYLKAIELGLTKDHGFVVEQCRQRMTNPHHPARRSQFKPGIVPWNTGQKYQPGGRSAETRFKPGNKPHTWVPIGSERINSDGGLERKVADTGHVRTDWRPVAVLVWEAAHGPVPTGHVVIFKPGCKTAEASRITPDVLECLSRGELMRRNSYHSKYPRELARLVQLRGALSRQINKRAKEAAGS